MFFQTLLLMTLGSSIHAFKILVIFTTPSLSHQIPAMALTERLVQEGHELFVISPNAVPGLKSVNYTFVDISFMSKMFSDEETHDAFSLQRQMSKWDMLISSAQKTPTTLMKDLFFSESFLEFQRRVKEEQIKFDVTILESIGLLFSCPMSRLLTGNTPIITLSSFSTDYAEDALGSITHYSYVPSWWDSYTDKMTLWQKVENWSFELFIKVAMGFGMEYVAKSFFRENYGAADLVEGCWTNVSLSLIASNSLYYYPRLLGPNVIELGPMHLKIPKNLPKDLQDWLDGAEKGVIYFSLGSNMKSKSLPEDARSNFLKFFSELPPGYRVLWKWELDGKIPGQSDNILAQKWLPQHSILAHRKVKFFITQGGIQSFQETVHYGVPTVVIPWFGDQESNAAKMVEVEIGVRLRPQELNSYEKVKTALEAVLYDDRYSKNMKRLSAISRDFTSQSLDKGVFWVEHVARHGGASHLKPSTADTTYIQYFCLDIISVILGLSFIILYIIYSACKFLILKISKKSTSKIKRS